MTGSRIGVLWRRAPFALRHYPSVLVAVFAAALLVALAASSSPFVTTAAASNALENRLVELTPYATGLVVNDERVEPGSFDAGLREERRRAAAVQQLAAKIPHVGRPVLTLAVPQDSPTINITGPAGQATVQLMARTGFLRHIQVLKETAGNGVWISDLSSHATGLQPGDTFGLHSKLRVKGIYRALLNSPQRPYWANLYQDIFPPSLDAPPPPPFVLMSRDQLLRTAIALRAGLSGMAELPVDPNGITLVDARALTKRFAAIRRALPRSSLGQKLGCAIVFRASPCKTYSSLSAAVILANENASAVTPAVSLLSDLGSGIALGVAAAAGVFLVRRRRSEAELLFARGEHVATFTARTAIEVFLPTMVGGAAGFGIAFGLTSVFVPHGSIDPATVSAGLAYAGIAVAIGLCLLVATAGFIFQRLFDTGLRARRWLRVVPWELPLLAVAVFLLVEIRAGHGLSSAGSAGAHDPTLAVFVFPLLLVAGAAGLAARLGRMVLRTGSGNWVRAQPAAVYLALRRLGAARGLLVLLAVVSAVALGSLFYAETLAASLSHTTIEKAYMATGSDAQATVADGEPLPRRFPFPLTEVEFSNQNVSIGGPDGTEVDVMLVNPTTLAGALHWESDWGTNPAKLLRMLERSPSRPLPVIVTSDLANVRGIFVQGGRLPLHVLGTVHAFPEMAAGIPLVITSFRALNQSAAQAKIYDPLGVVQTYVWAKGPPIQAERSLTASSLAVYYPSSTETFLHDPTVVLATRTYGYMRAIAIGAGILVLIGLLLYLQARQRSQAIASALARRMGLSRAAETLSLCLELGAILSFAGLVGGGIAIAAAAPVSRHLDPLPQDAPSPIFAIPTTTILITISALVALTFAAGLLTSWLAARADMSKELRVA